MSELSFRAILIGVGVFMTLATLTVIILYYNSTLDVANKLNERTNIELTNSDRITSILAKTQLTGTDVRNIIRYYYLKPLVKINLTKIKGVDKSSEALYKNINNTWTLAGLGIIDDSNMERINPSYVAVIVLNTMVGNEKIINIELN